METSIGFTTDAQSLAPKLGKKKKKLKKMKLSNQRESNLAKLGRCALRPDSLKWTLTEAVHKTTFYIRVEHCWVSKIHTRDSPVSYRALEQLEKGSVDGNYILKEDGSISK